MIGRTQKHYPAPLAIPLPNYSYDGKELERQVKHNKLETQVKLMRIIFLKMFSTDPGFQASARFGTIPRVTKLHEAGANHSHEKGGEHENRYRWTSSEGTRYFRFGSFGSQKSFPGFGFSFIFDRLN